MRYKTPLPIAVFAVAAVLSLPATASAFTHIPLPAPIPAPSGEVQYTVTETTFESNETVPGVTPWRRLEESWASATAARNVLTNAEDGQLLSECASTATSYSCFDADDHDLLLNGGSPALDAAGRSWQTAGARIKTLIAAGALRQTGSTTFLGRPAYTFVGTSDEEGHLTVVADAATYYPLEQAVTCATVCAQDYLLDRPGGRPIGSVGLAQPLEVLGRSGGWEKVQTEFHATGWVSRAATCGGVGGR
jgi:hypothetical protein